MFPLLTIYQSTSADESLVRTLNLAGANALLDILMIGITSLAVAYVVPLVAIPLWLRGRRELAVDVVVLLAITILVTEALKVATAKPRPCEALPGVLVIAPEFCPGSLDAFPSGHASRAFALAGLVATRARVRVSAPAFLVAGLVGVSRIYLGVHWPSDVLGGAILGVALALAFVVVAKRSERYRRIRGRFVAVLRGVRSGPPGA
ncbi:MAG: phosphatase PAP2 family protein [Methanobacteriota archaeon]